MDTPTISAEPIDGYLESCYAAFLRGDPRPELSPEIEHALTPDSRGRIDEVVERLRRRAEARRGRRKQRRKPTAAAGSSPDPFPKVPDYEITGLLDAGGFGRVYRAISRRHFGVPVALKILRSPCPSEIGPEAPERRLLMTRLLIGEAQVLAYIGHRNVVRYLGSGIVEAGPEAGTPFIATELIDGPSLARRIGQAPQDPRWSARILAQVADALDFVHQLKLQRSPGGDDEDPGPGILHRDVKPSNILLGRGDQPILTDFGLAGRVGRAASDEGFVAGTAAYSAPEQLRADAALTPAVDVYGLGATFYHLLTAQPPRREPAAADPGGAKAGPRLVAPRRLASRIPADLERICLKCLEEDPSRRYQTAGAVRDDLHRFLDGKPVSIHPVGPWGRAVRWARHSPLAATLAASLVLALTGGLLGMSVLWRRAEFERGRAERERLQAQAAQARAESDSLMAIELVGQLIELNAGGWDLNPKMLSLEDTASLLESTRRHLLALAPREPDRERFFKQLSLLDERLYRVLSDLRRWDELRTLLEESVRESEAAVRWHPRTISAWRCQAGHHGLLALLAERQERANDCEAHWRQALASAEEWCRSDRVESHLGRVADFRRTLARHLASHGRQAEARELLLANHHWLLHCGPELFMGDKIVADRVFSYLEFRYLGLGALPPLTAEETGRPDCEIVLASAAADDLPATAWANLAATSLHFGDQRLPANLEAKVASWFTHNLAHTARDQHHRGQFDQAGRTVDRILALGRLVVERNPKDPLAYLVLAKAFDQAQQNARRPTEDRPVIELNLRRAVEAAQHAADLAPHYVAFRQELERFQRELFDFLHP